MKTIRIHSIGTQHDYRESLIPLLIHQLGYRVDWVKSASCDLLIYGAFYQEVKKSSWIPKPLRPLLQTKKSESTRQYQPLTLFHTCESLRHDHVPADFSISFDLGVRQENHLRLPYWYELVDWSHEGIGGNHNPRYGELLSLKRLGEPLGSKFLDRPQKAVLITSHLIEPRKMLFDAVRSVVPTTGMGPFFDSSIRNHHQSSFCKKDVLKEFAFNLCPENNLYPGYYTEKIPEAFLSGCLALSWVDSNVSVDFNSKAFINLQPMVRDHFRELNELLHSRERLLAFANEPLVLQQPSLEPVKQFVSEMLRQALS